MEMEGYVSTVEDRMINAIEELEQENRLLRARNDRLEAEAKVVSVQEPVAIPEGFSLVAVKGFDELMYWLDRCERKGHLENCPDLIEPYAAFDYRTIDTTPPAAQRQWVDLTDRQIESIFIDAGWSWGEKADMYLPAVREVLKLFKEVNK
jgi:hypothetical protein